MLKRKTLGSFSYNTWLMALNKLQFSCGTFYPCGLKEVEDFGRIKGLRLKCSLDHKDVTFRCQDEGKSKNHSRVVGKAVGAQFVKEFKKPFRFPQVEKCEKIVVAVDVDEVLGSFISALNEFIADRYASYHTVSDYYIYEFFRIWKCTRAEAEIRVHEFFRTKYFTSGIHPIPGAHSALCNLSAFCNLSVVTSRQNVIKDHTCDWIERHYPGLFKDIHFGNHFALDGKSRPKSEICRSIGAQVLIDDNPRYAVECAKAGIRVLLFDYHNSYPWCKDGSVDSYRLVSKVHNWEEVEQHLMSWALV